MNSFKLRLRRVVEEVDLKKLLKFGAHKLPLTFLSYKSLEAIRTYGTEMFHAAFLNSMATQMTEFLLLRNGVFEDRSKVEKDVARQFTRFLVWSTVMALTEGIILSLLSWIGMSDGWAYIVGHIPTFFMRYYGDRKFVFRKQPAPGS